MSRISQGQGVLPVDRTAPGQEGVPSPHLAGPRKGPHRAATVEEGAARFDREAAALIYEAVGIFGAESWAAELSDMSGNPVDSGLVSRMRTGGKSTPLRALLPLLRDEKAALVLLTAMCRVAGLAPPRPVQRVTREQATEATVQAVRRVTALWEMVRRQVADELGADEEQVEGAFDLVAAK